MKLLELTGVTTSQVVIVTMPKCKRGLKFQVKRGQNFESRNGATLLLTAQNLFVSLGSLICIILDHAPVKQN